MHQRREPVARGVREVQIPGLVPVVSESEDQGTPDPDEWAGGGAVPPETPPSQPRRGPEGVRRHPSLEQGVLLFLQCSEDAVSRQRQFVPCFPLQFLGVHRLSGVTEPLTDPTPVEPIPVPYPRHPCAAGVSDRVLVLPVEVRDPRLEGQVQSRAADVVSPVLDEAQDPAQPHRQGVGESLLNVLAGGTLREAQMPLLHVLEVLVRDPLSLVHAYQPPHRPRSEGVVLRPCTTPDRGLYVRSRCRARLWKGTTRHSCAGRLGVKWVDSLPPLVQIHLPTTPLSSASRVQGVGRVGVPEPSVTTSATGVVVDEGATYDRRAGGRSFARVCYRSALNDRLLGRWRMDGPETYESRPPPHVRDRPVDGVPPVT